MIDGALKWQPAPPNLGTSSSSTSDVDDDDSVDNDDNVDNVGHFGRQKIGEEVQVALQRLKPKFWSIETDIF